MSHRTWLALVTVATASCGAKPRPELAARVKPGTLEVTLYRDHAVVAHHVAVEVPPASTGRVRIKLAAGIAPDDVYVIDRGELTVEETRSLSPPPRASTSASVDPPPEAPGEVELVVAAPRAGTFPLAVGYDTDRIKWDAAYTMTTTPARDRVDVRGALAIRNATGLALRDATLWVVDAEHGPVTNRIAERVGGKLVAPEPHATPTAVPRELGRVQLLEGTTRVELLAGTPPRPVRSVLVYDPIGTKLDHAGPAPVRDPQLGIRPPASTKVSESLEIERDLPRTLGLPAGPVRLLERKADGSLVTLAEARLFDAATAVAHVDTIAIGIAAGVTGKRERRELTLDEDRKRLVEEFVITLDNARPRPVEVVVREHLYRGQNWSLAYHSAPSATKEGPQQVTLRTTVPAKASGKLLYVVVYTW